MFNNSMESMKKITKFLFSIVFFFVGLFVFIVAWTNPEMCDDPFTIKIIGCFFMGASAFPLFFPILVRRFGRRNSKLEHTGECIWATIKVIEVDYNTVINGNYAHWVVCEVINQAENTIYRYTSNKVYEDLFARMAPGNQVAVYVNYDDPDDYYVNLNEIM